MVLSRLLLSGDRHCLYELDKKRTTGNNEDRSGVERIRHSRSSTLQKADWNM